MAKATWIAAFSTLITIVTGYTLFKCSKKQRGKEAHKRPPFGVPDEVPEYIYQPLGDPSLKTIRLIELLPFDPDKPHTGIRTRLRTTSLAVPVPEKYEAISYCWGDASDVRSIYCNGSKLWITASLRNALVRLSKLSSDNDQIRVLWADAICINQKDLDEQNWQVQMMPDIYGKAERVTIYLGEHSYDSELLEDFIPQLARSKKRIDEGVPCGDLIADTRLSSEQRKQYNIPTYDWSNWRHFLALSVITSRPWFRRVWTIQELVLAKDAIVICGYWTVSWSDFKAAVEFAGKDYTTTGADVVDVGPNRVLSLSIKKANAQEVSLFQLLVLHINTLASNPLDHIFALLSLAIDRDQVEIDYKKSVRQVYEDTGRYLLASTTDLSPLYFAGLSRQADPQFPSWLPDWRVPWNSFPIVTYHEQQLKSQSCHMPTWDGEKLKLMGVMIDTVALMGCKSPENRFEDVKSGVDFTIETLAVYDDWIRTFKAYSTKVYGKTGETKFSAFWTTIVGPESTQSDVDCQRFRQLTIPITIAKFIKALPFPKYSNHFARMGPLQALKILLFTIPTSLLEIYRLFRGTRTDVPGSIGNSVGRRKLETTSGYLCLAPQETEIGDYVFLLCGGPSYYILRKLSGDDTYALVGDCYVHGLEEEIVCGLEDSHPVWIA